jgi:hypothetical protein
VDLDFDQSDVGNLLGLFQDFDVSGGLFSLDDNLVDSDLK